MKKRTIGIHEKLPLLQSLPLSLQHLTAMFGATILVPILLGIDPAMRAENISVEQYCKLANYISDNAPPKES